MPGVCAQSARSRHLIGRSLGGARKKLTGHGRYKIWHFKPSEGREAALPSILLFAFLQDFVLAICLLFGGEKQKQSAVLAR